MASKKQIALTIERKCPKCGKTAEFCLINVKAIRLAERKGEEIPAKIYRCSECGYKVEK